MSRDFKFTVPLDNTYVIRSEMDPDGQERQWMVLRGWASDSSVDKLKGKMSERCIVGMVSAVNEGSPSPVFRNVQAAKNPTRMPVGIDVDHSSHWTDQIGRATVARALYEGDIPSEMIARGVTPPVMYVEFEVDLRKSHGRDLKVAMDDGDQLGLSIFGRVRKAHKEVNRSTGDTIEHFDEVDLHRIAVTSRPVNNVTWIQEIRRSFEEDEMPTETPEQEATSETTEEVAAPAISPESAEPVADAMQESTAQAEGNTEETNESTEVSTEPVATEEVAPSPAQPEPAPVAPTATSAAEPEGLSLDALADIAGLGAPMPGAAPEPVVEPAPVSAETAPVAESTESAESTETVQRAEEETPETPEIPETPEYVLRSAYAEFEGEVRGVVGTLTEALQKAEELIAQQDAVIRSLTDKVSAIEGALNKSLGRRGTVARSFAEEETADKGLTEQIGKEQRERIMRELVARGQGHIATAMIMEQAGILKLPNQPINDPLLPGNSN